MSCPGTPRPPPKDESARRCLGEKWEGGAQAEGAHVRVCVCVCTRVSVCVEGSLCCALQPAGFCYSHAVRLCTVNGVYVAGLLDSQG